MLDVRQSKCNFVKEVTVWVERYIRCVKSRLTSCHYVIRESTRNVFQEWYDRTVASCECISQ